MLLIMITAALAAAPEGTASGGAVTVQTTNAHVSDEWIEDFSTHTWTTACPELMERRDKAFKAELYPIHDDESWVVETVVRPGTLGVDYGFGNPDTRCLQREFDKWLVEHPITGISMPDSFQITLTWKHATAAEPTVREPIEIPLETPRSPIGPPSQITSPPPPTRR